MIFAGQVGQQNNPDGSGSIGGQVARMGHNGDLIVSELHGRYYEQAYRKNLYGGSIVGQVTTVGAATTYTGLCLSNPVGSGVNLVINKVGVSFLVGFAASATVGVMTGINVTTNVTHTAAAVVRNKFIGSVAGMGLLDSSATLPTAPVLDIVLFSGLTGAITTAPAADGMFDLEGSIILPPGAYAAIYTSTVSGTASMSASFSWEEVPV
jgi:energy-converting hydrogenase Eha subunit E